MHHLGRVDMSPHLAEEIRTAEIKDVQKAIPQPRNCRVQASTRDSLTVAWDQTEAVPGGLVEVAIFAHGNDQEPVQRREVGCDQTDVRMGGLRAGTKYDARVRVRMGQLRGKEVMTEARTESFWPSVSRKQFVIACIVLVIAIFLQMALVKSTERRCLYPKDILDTRNHIRPNLFGREEDIANLTAVLEKKGKCLVIGLSGVGKTAMVKEYMYRKSIEYTAGIVWITSYDDINFLFVDVLPKATGRDPIEYDYRDKSLEWTTKYLSQKLLVRQKGKFLFVFDDVETSQYATDMLKMIPDRSVESHVILMSRREVPLSNVPKMKLHPLTEDAAVQLYRSLEKCGEDSDIACIDRGGFIQKIVHLLGYLPYAMIHYLKNAEPFHKENDEDYTPYNSWDLLSRSVLSIRFRLTGYERSKNPIVDEVKMVQKECPKAYELLVVFSFFNHYKKVPWCILRGKGTDWEHPMFKGQSYYELIECLENHSLVQLEGTDRSCEITLNRIVTLSVMYTVDSVEEEERYYWTALEMSVRAVNRLQDLTLYCRYNRHSVVDLDCQAKDQWEEMFSRVLEHSSIVARNAVNKAISARFERCHMDKVVIYLSPEMEITSITIKNPSSDLTSWLTNMMKVSDDEFLYTWPRMRSMRDSGWKRIWKCINQFFYEDLIFDP
ncbi:uncharacterized protein LOC144876889 isoform X2 [Branchiostoma floridae x Branchiostoma japonicum]